MAKIASKVLRNVSPSPSDDVVEYRLRIISTGDTVDDIYNEPPYYSGPEYTDLDLAALDGVNALQGEYNIFQSAVDTAGNESDFNVIGPVVLDFFPPEPPGGGTVS
jgi:hypothetical protein